LWDGARQAVSWDDSFRELAEFKEEHGHCNVRQRGSKLGVWLHQQRYVAASPFITHRLMLHPSIARQ
jgi:hypothetical protein